MNQLAPNHSAVLLGSEWMPNISYDRTCSDEANSIAIFTVVLCNLRTCKKHILRMYTLGGFGRATCIMGSAATARRGGPSHVKTVWGRG